MRAALTVMVWIVSLLSLMAAGLIATTFLYMATSMDPTELISVGIAPWTEALQAALAFIGIAAATVLTLVLWHRTRFKVVALILAALQAGCVAWGCVYLYTEYF